MSIEQKKEELIKARITPYLRDKIDSLEKEFNISDSEFLRAALWFFVDEANVQIRSAKSPEEYRWIVDKIAKSKLRDMLIDSGAKYEGEK